MGYKVVVTDEWVNGVGFIDIQPVGKTIEAWLLKAGCLPHPWHLKARPVVCPIQIMCPLKLVNSFGRRTTNGIFYRRTTQVVFIIFFFILLVLTRIYCSCQGKQNIICMSKEGIPLHDISETVTIAVTATPSRAAGIRSCLVQLVVSCKKCYYYYIFIFPFS